MLVEDLRRVATLAAFWDTLGWVYFRLSDLPAAEKFLHAAWILGQDPIIGDHLGQVYESEGKSKEAAHMYELAYVAGGEGVEAADRYKKLTGKNLNDANTPKLARRPNSTTASAPISPGEELSRMRTVKVPTITSKKPAPNSSCSCPPGPKWRTRSLSTARRS